MATSLRKIDVELLQIGMYVSELDRPWLETPFLFQGFYIRTDSEIEELRRFCDTVEIDIEQSDASLQATLAAKTTPPKQGISTRSSGKRISLWQRILALFSGKRINDGRQTAAESITRILLVPAMNSSSRKASIPIPWIN